MGEGSLWALPPSKIEHITYAHFYFYDTHHLIHTQNFDLVSVWMLYAVRGNGVKTAHLPTAGGE